MAPKALPSNDLTSDDLASNDSVIIRDDASHSMIAIARDSVLQVERRVVVGRRGLRGMGLGFVAGLLAGAVAGAISSPCSAQSECMEGFAVVGGGVGGAVLGLVSGGVIGSFVRYEDWSLVALPPRSSLP